MSKAKQTGKGSVATVAASPTLTANGKRVGRPPGKRSNPDYLQASVWIRKDTHNAVKLQLLQAGEGQEVSELVQALLEEWLTNLPSR